MKNIENIIMYNRSIIYKLIPLCGQLLALREALYLIKRSISRNVAFQLGYNTISGLSMGMINRQCTDSRKRCIYL